jgi:hypothetical protein
VGVSRKVVIIMFENDQLAITPQRATGIDDLAAARRVDGLPLLTDIYALVTLFCNRETFDDPTLGRPVPR